MDLTGLGSLFDFGGKIIDKIFPDPQKAQEAKIELFKLQQSGELAQMAGQMAINKEEAKSTSVFIAGWRPFIGWVCGSAFAFNFVVGPILVSVASVYSIPMIIPALAIDQLLPVLFGMLGLGAYRTYEKVKGVEGNR